MFKIQGMQELEKRISIGHSSDPDDAFMYYGLYQNKPELIRGQPFSFSFFQEDISTLNNWGNTIKLDITALSMHAYCHLSDKYQLLPHGGSFGDNYGPLLLTADKKREDDWYDYEVAIPGKYTSAFLTLKLFAIKPLQVKELPFREIIPAIQRGDFASGLIIHEGQLTWEEKKLFKIVDLGEWWMQKEGLPLPLGVNAIRRDLAEAIKRKLSGLLLDSINFSLANREEAVRFAMQYAPDISYEITDRFIQMYVNELTQNYGKKGKAAVRCFVEKAVEAGHIPDTVRIDFISGEMENSPV
ncbi:menaquinone biosynthesis family protein [Candidatus Riflebacteria bacterium]